MAVNKKPAAANQVINVPTLHVQLTPLAFHQLARRYRDTARSSQLPTELSPVPYRLYCRSLELSFKAFLLLNGVSKEELKRKPLGHNLHQILARAEALALSTILAMSGQERHEVAKENAYYVDKDFEYANVVRAVDGYRDLPDLAVLDGLVERLLVSLEPLCLST